MLVTFRFRHAQGHWVELESLATDLLDHPGVQGIMVTMRDLTERKRMEEALRENFHRLELILNTIPGPIWVKDRDGRYQAVNLAWLQFFEVELEDVLGKTPQQLFPPEIADRLAQEDLEVIVTRKQTCHIEQMVGAKGRVNWFDTTKVPLEDSSGVVIGTVGVARDITEQKDLEAKLLQAQKMEAVGQLAGGIAHDFNNILAVITLHLALLRENQNLDAQTQDSLAELNHEAQRAANLTRQLLLFSRRSVLESKVVDLNELVGNLVKMLGRLIGEHIVLRFDRHPDLPPVKGDAGMIEQVLMNLAVNARDAMPKGGKLTLDLTPIEADANRIRGKVNVEPGPFICLSVADTGVGMDAAILKRIFEPFFTTKEPGKGTGLGLATVYGIVAQHQGWVDVESEPGQGTTFNVFFPATAKTTPKSVEIGRTTIVRGQETILLVEDEESVRRVVMQVLRKLGYRVLEAANGPEALKVWQEHADHIDLLFTDMMMPEGVTGLDLAEKLRQDRPGLKVVISSGYNPEMGREGSSTAGAIVYLQKPYPIDVISKTIRECLDRQ
jgi:PAS domain S-box-containing protein